MAKADTTVILNLTGGAPPDSSWKQCKNHAGVVDGFWYKFTGGNTGNDDGTWEFTVDNSNDNKFIDIKIEAADGWDPSKPETSPGYRITDVPITYDGSVSDDKKDISIQSDSDPRCWQLKDKNKDVESGEFKVVASFTTGGENPTVVTDIETDPAWRNKR